MRTPELSVATTEFKGRAASEERETLETVRAPEETARPEPVKS